MKALRVIMKFIGATLLLCAAGFCVFGFLASFEPGNGLAWKIGYGTLGCICLVGAVALFRRKGDDRKPSIASARRTEASVDP